jgi:hypothetical protein
MTTTWTSSSCSTLYRNFSDEAHIDRHATLEKNLKGVKTLISNPMQQGEASKIALFSIGDYAWNRGAFDNEQSWMARCEAVFGKHWPQAFKTRALHQHL